MPSSGDFMNKLNDILGALTSPTAAINARLDALKTSTDAVKASTDQVRAAIQQMDSTLTSGLTALVNLANYTNQALFHNAQQNDTIICILEHISRNTCAILNETHQQTGLQKSIEKSASLLADLYSTTHAEAMVAHTKLAKLQADIDACCPPPLEPLPCSYEPCQAPRPLPEPRPERPPRPTG